MTKARKTPRHAKPRGGCAESGISRTVDYITAWGTQPQLKTTLGGYRRIAPRWKWAAEAAAVVGTLAALPALAALITGVM